MVYLVLGKDFNSLWHDLYALGQIFIAENDQILKTQLGHLVTLILGHKLYGQDRTGPERYIASNETFLCQKNNIERFADSRLFISTKSFQDVKEGTYLRTFVPWSSLVKVESLSCHSTISWVVFENKI